MKNFILILLLITIGCTTRLNQETINLADEQILVGKVNWQGLTQPPYDDWFTPTYLSYRVDSTTLTPLDSGLEDIEILMFMGTWCEDSRLQVPQFYKILDHLNYNLSSMTVVALERLESRKLVSPQHEEADYSISHVPTFIFMHNGREIGRITEYPEKTLEKDIIEIVSN